MWLGIFLLIMSLVSAFQPDTNSGNPPNRVSYTALMEKVESGSIEWVRVTGNDIDARDDAGSYFQTKNPGDPDFIPTLRENDVEIMARDEPSGSLVGTLLGVLISWFPMLLLIGVWIWFMRSMQGKGGPGPLGGFGKSKHKMLTQVHGTVTFADVAGVEEAKRDLEETVEFLRNPTKFTELGGRMPTGLLMVGPPGTGKAQPLDSMVKIPGGWKTMGDLQPGDEVATPDGSSATVLETFPQGIKPIYEIMFDDGSTVQCCLEHLWKVHSKDFNGGDRSRLMTLSEIKDKMARTKGWRPWIPLTKPVYNPKIDLPLDPYLLGIYLGDGSTAHGGDPMISSADEFIINYISNILDPGYEIKNHRYYDYVIRYTKDHRKTMVVGKGSKGNYLNKYSNILWDLGLLDKKSSEKFIPDIYFRADYESRLSLIQGLMDSDGTAEKTGSSYFTSTSYELIDGLRSLILSVGGKCLVKGPGRKFYTYRGENRQGSETWALWVRLPNNGDLFKLPRKKELASKLVNTNFHWSKCIEDIRYIGEKEAKCILIDSEEHLYITDYYTVTHNTLLARSVAGEAGVPFFTISGSDFVEMFVGVGAARVRDLFEQAKKNAPCIVFIDEIDAVGRRRGAGLGGGNDEREQTLNQILVEMDGFEANEGVVIIAATNRPDVLDPALTRPGRFDRQVVVSNPDLLGREAILKVHTKKIKLSPNVNLLTVARGTPGFSGADLANLVNEAALMAARNNRRMVTSDDFEMAKDKIMLGTERRSLIMTEEERKLTAHHEAGHAIVAYYTPSSDPIHKATIIPRGRALGMVVRLPEGDRISISREQMEGNIAVAMGGRVAEEITFGYNKVTAGAASDIQQVTDIARRMVTQWGMSEKLGAIQYGGNEQEVFLGRQVTERKTISEETAQLIDQEIRRFVDEGYNTARSVIEQNKEAYERLAQSLLDHETLTGEEVSAVIKGQPLPDPAEVEEEVKKARHSERPIRQGSVPSTGPARTNPS